MISIILLIILIPFQIYFDIYGNLSVSVAQALLGILFLYLCVFDFGRLKKTFKDTNFTPAVACFLSVIALSVIYGLGYRGILWVLKWTGFVLVYFISFSVIDSRKKINNVIIALFVTGFILSVIGVWEYLLPGQKVMDIIKENKGFFSLIMEPSTLKMKLETMSFNWYRPDHVRAFGTFINVNVFPAYLGLVFPFIFILWSITGKKWIRILLIIASIFMFTAVVLSFSRGGWIGMLASILVAGIIYFKDNLKTLLKIIAGVLIVAGVLMFVKVPVFQRLQTKILSIGETLEGRAEIWKEGMSIIAQRPFLGAGLNNYGIAFNKYLPEKQNPRLPHSNYIYIGAEMGIMGLTALVFLIFTGIYSSLLLFKINYFYGLSFLLIWVWFSFHSIVEHFFWGDKFSVLFWLIVGLNAAVVREFKSNVNQA